MVDFQGLREGHWPFWPKWPILAKMAQNDRKWGIWPARPRFFWGPERFKMCEKPAFLDPWGGVQVHLPQLAIKAGEPLSVGTSARSGGSGHHGRQGVRDTTTGTGSVHHR